MLTYIPSIWPVYPQYMAPISPVYGPHLPYIRSLYPKFVCFCNVLVFQYFMIIVAIAERYINFFIYKTCTHDSENICLFRTHTCLFGIKKEKFRKLKCSNFFKKIFFNITCCCSLCNKLIQIK